MKIGETMKDETYCENIDEILKELITDKEGLTTEEVSLRQTQQGKNELKAKKARTLFDMLLEQLTDKMIIILLIASLLSFFF